MNSGDLIQTFIISIKTSLPKFLYMAIVNIKQSKQEGAICFISLLFVLRNCWPSNSFVEIGWNLYKILSTKWFKGQQMWPYTLMSASNFAKILSQRFSRGAP